MTKKRNRMQAANRIIWMFIFLSVSAALAWAEWQSGPTSGVGWFLAVSLWSALCGIGFSVGDWLLRGRSNDEIKKGAAAKSDRQAEHG